QFFRMVGTTTAEQLDLVPLEPGYRVYGEPSSAPQSPIDVRTGVDAASDLFESREHGAGDRVRAYLASATSTYRAAVSAFLYNPFSSWRSFATSKVLAAAPAVFPLLVRSLWTFIARRFTDTRL